LIPEQLDVVIGDHYFEVEFEVERLGIDENGEEAEFVWPSVTEESGEGDVDKGGQRGEEMFGRLHKKQKRDEAESEKERKEVGSEGVGEGFISWKEQVLNMSKEEFETFLRAKAREISNIAADEVIGELADRVVEEKDEDQQGKGESEAEAGVLHRADWGGEMTDRIREAAAVPEACKGQTRASPRLQRSRDEHVWLRPRSGQPRRT
jgi:hypothetical protein